MKKQFEEIGHLGGNPNIEITERIKKGKVNYNENLHSRQRSRQQN